VCLDEGLNPLEFRPCKMITTSQPYRLKPKLRLCVVSFYVHMEGLRPISGIEEEPVRSDPQHCWHTER